jgi:hypothetical protein
MRFVRLWDCTFRLPGKPPIDLARRMADRLRDIERTGVDALAVAPFQSTTAAARRRNAITDLRGTCVR